MTFHELGLDESILKSIDEFGFKEPTPIQAGSIPHILEGLDVIGSAQTGTGKTAAYALPILHRLGGHKQGAAPRCLVLGPTRELLQGRGSVCLLRQVQPKASSTVVSATANRSTRLKRWMSSLRRGSLLDHLQQKNFDLSQSKSLC